MELPDRTWNGIRSFLAAHYIEGLVFWKDGEPKCKIRRKDFGFNWGDKKRGLPAYDLCPECRKWVPVNYTSDFATRAFCAECGYELWHSRTRRFLRLRSLHRFRPMRTQVWAFCSCRFVSDRRTRFRTTLEFFSCDLLSFFFFCNDLDCIIIQVECLLWMVLRRQLGGGRRLEFQWSLSVDDIEGCCWAGSASLSAA